MGIQGPAPKDDAVRRNKATFDKIIVEWDGVVRGPSLPDDYDWCNRTEQWWDMWRRSAQAMVWLESDWEHMLETAMLHTRFWDQDYPLKPTEMKSLAEHIRQRMQVLGSTFEDRRKLRLEVRSAEADKMNEAQIDAAAAVAVDYMERMTNLAAQKLES